MLITTGSGAVRGRNHNGANVFLGIPYAAPPVGAARFAAPAPHPGWTGIRDAAVAGPTAPQPARDAFGGLDMSPFFGPGWVRGDDYLTANVWAPEDARKRPVMVFVHGGGFVSGSKSSPLYDGSSFARGGIVMVTINYRLGVPGFLDVAGAPPNRGLLDVMAGLRWVRDNIAGFGGDPDNVTVFGQSAGATIVAALLATPNAAGLFRRAIVQSGSGTGTFHPEQAARVTEAVGAALGVRPTAEGLAEVPDERLVRITPALSGLDLRTADRFDPLVGLSPFGLVLERQPVEDVTGEVDLIVGTNAEEGNLYLAPGGDLDSTTPDDVLATAARAHRDPAGLVATYRAARPGASHGELRSAILGDALFGAGNRLLAEAHSRSQGRTHVYEFAWRSSALDGRLGAAHGVELPFVFDRTGLAEVTGPNALLGAGEPPAALTTLMHNAWISFAENGDPGWERFGESRRTLRIAENPVVVDDPRGEELRAW
ncbi:carboxylesterase/lipase family protein [Saccharopolyspora taberi]|uniref:Carboxylic ester hydrolase n=1 Tax=Saccharopolyspora taberi TaxID=60895 RepID=A0ABN3VH94_9PSEU